MKRALVFALCVACAGTAKVAHPVVLAPAPAHVPTIAERRADVCSRSDLVALEGPVVASGAAVVEQGNVTSVAVRDASGRDVDVDAQTLALVTRDAPLDMARSREVVRRLWTSGKWDDVALETSRDGDGLAVVFRVTPKRAIANVFSSGYDDVASLRVLQGAPYDPVAFVSARRSLVKELGRNGRLDASVVFSSAFGDLDRRTVDVCVRVVLGPLVVLDAIQVKGSAYASLIEPVFSSHAHGMPLDEDVLVRDILLADAALYDVGLLVHKIEKTIERHDDKLTVRVDVTDGPVYRYSRIDVKGDLLAPKAEYTKLVTPKAGDVFNRSKMLQVIDSIRAFDATKGRSDEIEPETALDEKTHTVALVLGIKQIQR